MSKAEYQGDHRQSVLMTVQHAVEIIPVIQIGHRVDQAYRPVRKKPLSRHQGHHWHLESDVERLSFILLVLSRLLSGPYIMVHVLNRDLLFDGKFFQLVVSFLLDFTILKLFVNLSELVLRIQAFVLWVLLDLLYFGLNFTLAV